MVNCEYKNVFVDIFSIRKFDLKIKGNIRGKEGYFIRISVLNYYIDVIIVNVCVYNSKF